MTICKTYSPVETLADKMLKFRLLLDYSVNLTWIQMVQTVD